MWSRIGRVTHVLLTLTAVGCCAWLLWREYHRPDPDHLSTHADMPLRNFLDVRWLGGDYELPRGEDHCAVVILEFENGKFLGRQAGRVFSPQPGGSRVIPYYVMWGKGPNNETRVTTGWPGSWGATSDPFYAKLNGGVGRAYGTTSLGEVRGYRVIGYGFSMQTRPGKERYRDFSSDVEQALDTRQSVVLLGVKPFSTREEAEHWLYGHDEPTNP